jgi:hypothetical protein
VVEATTSLGRRVLTKELTLDTRPPRVIGLSARRSGGGTAVRFRLSEQARIEVRLGVVTVTLRRGGGAVTLWRRARPARISVRAEDAAQNLSAPVSAAVRRS